MARIRTIKPEFFTSDDIVNLSPWGRLLYIALWCEADRCGRLLWKPQMLKRRYFPDDTLNITDLCNELVAADLVRLYGDGLAYIPQFSRHQHLNPRESESVLPDPSFDASPTRAAPVSTRPPPAGSGESTVQTRVPHRQGGREGKGREGNVLVPTVLVETPDGVADVSDQEAFGMGDMTTETGHNIASPLPISASYRPPPCPYEQIANAYNDLLPALPALAVLSDSRKRTLQARWKEVCIGGKYAAAAGLDYFKWFFGQVSESKFLMGQAPTRQGARPFMADFDWLMTPTYFPRVVEGRYNQ